jgi:5-methylthioadenosine/S-adenosylhomocysteine deaminase
LDGFVGAHWTFCTPPDIDLLTVRGVQMAHCPANSSRREPYTALIGRIRDTRVNIALGSDNMTQDMFQAMKMTTIGCVPVSVGTQRKTAVVQPIRRG